jgi:hypothetical protein
LSYCDNLAMPGERSHQKKSGCTEIAGSRIKLGKLSI